MSARVSEDHLFYLSGGGYQQLEDKTGTYLTDTVLGYTQPELFNIGDNTASSLNLQFTVPTSETSQKQELITALRLTVPLSYRDGNWSASVAPRLRKNLHQYTTAGGKALTSWISSLHLSSSYSFYDFTLSGSLLGGTSWSYEGTRRNWDYGGSAALSYQAMKNLAASLSVSTSGVYYDAERGTLGNIDLFDERKATYTMSLIFSF
ncbi:hypothetical protein [Photobacterium sp. 1_MG-2023]|uniref:hypothetical protein n=1 Tax=Photobacterium sp. 1_MG-2023 TaxID=3062646 RepID=UPI0026E2ADDD|nr:hypothetical protein [Photobacterium sp. 1_MG-2023]MDO6707834.1 hypothetical protein [Photobacterium sp. 1_MG-2023]